MKTSTLLEFSLFGLTTVLFRRKKPILGTINSVPPCKPKNKWPLVYSSTNNWSLVDKLEFVELLRLKGASEILALATRVKS